MKGHSKKIVTSIDVGTYRTRVVVAETDHESSKKIRVLGVGQSDTTGVRHGYIVNIESVTASIEDAVRQAEEKSGTKIREAVVSIGGVTLESETHTGYTVVSRSDGEVSDMDIQTAIAMCEEKGTTVNKRILHTIPIDYILDGEKTYGYPRGMHGIKLGVRTLIVTCLEQHLDDLILAIHNTGIDVVDIIASPIAASIVTVNERQKTAGCVLVDIGSETVSATIFEDGVPIALHTFSIGSTDITNDIALGFQIPIEEAECIKIGSLETDHSKKKLNTIIEARIMDIFELINKYLKKNKRSELLPAGAIIIGGGSRIESTPILAKRTFHFSAKIGTAENMVNHKDSHKNHSWFTSYGLCVAGLYYENARFSREKKWTTYLKDFKERFTSIIKEFLP